MFRSDLQVVLSEPLAQQAADEDLRLIPDPDALHTAADKLGLYLPLRATSLLHLPDEEPPLDLLPQRIRGPVLVVSVGKLATDEIRDGFVDTLNALRAAEQAEREATRDTTNRCLEYAGVGAGFVMAARFESAGGQLLGLGVAIGSLAARAYTYFRPVELRQITDSESVTSPIVVKRPAEHM